MMPVNQSKQNSLFFFFFSETQKQSLFKDSIFWVSIFSIYLRYALMVQYLG